MICKIPKQEDLFDLSDKLWYVDIPKEIADKKATMYCGLGFELKHKENSIHELWHEFVKRNNFRDYTYLVERQMGEMGAVFITLNKAKNENMCLLNICQPYFANGIAESYCSPVAAVVVENILIDNNMHLIKSQYDTEKVVRTVWNAGTKGQVSIQDFVTKLPKEWELDWGTYDKEHDAFVKYHNLGFVPVKVMKNKPFKYYYPAIMPTSYWQSPFTTTWNYQSTGWTYESVKDTAKCTGLILQLNNLYTQKWKLALLDKPRVILNGISQGLSNSLLENKKQGYASNFFSDLIVNAGFGGANGAGLNIMTPTNNLSNYDDAIENLRYDIYKSSGLSYQRQTANQKTSTESYTNFQESLETLNFMRSYHTGQWEEVIEMAFKIMGKDLGDKNSWSFQFNRNIVIDEAAQIDNLIKEINQKSKTPIDMIAIRNGIDEDNAELIFEKNMKFYEKYGEKLAKLASIGNMQGTNGGYTGKPNEAGAKPKGE